MTRTLALLACFVLAAPAGLAQDAQPTSPEPAPPLELTPPPAPPAKYGEHDLKALDGDTLRANAFDRYQEGQLEDAIQLQHWGVLAKDGGGEGQYNLACFYALAGKVEAAFYWLQRAAKDEGVDAAWAAEDADLEVLRADARWAKVVEHLRAWNAWWEKSGRRVTLLVVPKGVSNEQPVPAVVGLHGFGSHPRDFADGEEYQALADRLGVAFVGVSGTVPIGPKTFRWAEDPAQDAARVASALAEVKNLVTITPGAVVLIGFSQGAQVAAELAARDPAAFAGAIVLSPGSREPVRLAEATKADAHAGRGFVVRVGAGEHPSNVAQADEVARALRALGCRVDEHAYEGMDEHTFPPDYLEKLGEWVTFCLGERRPQPR